MHCCTKLLPNGWVECISLIIKLNIYPCLRASFVIFWVVYSYLLSFFSFKFPQFLSYEYLVLYVVNMFSQLSDIEFIVGHTNVLFSVKLIILFFNQNFELQEPVLCPGERGIHPLFLLGLVCFHFLTSRSLIYSNFILMDFWLFQWLTNLPRTI